MLISLRMFDEGLSGEIQRVNFEKIDEWEKENMKRAKVSKIHVFHSTSFLISFSKLHQIHLKLCVNNDKMNDFVNKFDLIVISRNQ